MAKKMSVQEILAAARAEKARGTPAAPPPAGEQEPAPPPIPAAEAPAAASSEPASGASPSKPAAKPAGKMSVQEMIAAARAEKARGAAPAAKPAPAPKPAAEKPAAPAAPKPAVAKPEAKSATAVAPKDTASILAAARKTVKPGPISKSQVAAKAVPAAEPAKKKIEVPPMPPKPDYARPRPAAAAAQPQTRRGFISGLVGFAFGSSLAVGFSSLVLTHLMWLLGLARFMFPNILIEPPTRFKVGFPDAYAPGQVETKYIPQFGVWIVRYEYEGQPIIFALKSVCTHLGCTPNWLEAEQKFKCPCHGSGFYKDGINFEGPAPRPLERYAISLADDGQLLVDKSRTFNQELGQWTDPASFIPV